MRSKEGESRKVEHQIDIEHRVTEVEGICRDHDRRIEKLEGTTEAIQSLAVNMERMMLQQEAANKVLTKLTDDVETIKAEPAKKWRFVVEKALYFVIGGAMAVILARVGLG